MLRVREARLVVFLLGVLHLFSGLGMILFPQVAYVTSLSFFVDAFHSLGMDGHSHITVGVLIMLVGVLSICAIVLTHSLSLQARVWMVIPQQIVQTAQFISVCLAVIRGVYPDGYRPHGGGGFIFFDQFGMLLLSLYHTLWLLLALARLEVEKHDAR